MLRGKCLTVGFTDYEVMTINGEDWIKCRDLPNIARQLYGREAVDALSKVIDSVEFEYDEETKTLKPVRKDNKEDA